MPTIARPAAHASRSELMVSVRQLHKHFPIREGVFRHVVGHVRAVDGVTFDVRRGETVALVGESGCGKTTLGRCLAGLVEPTSGGIYFGLHREQQERLDRLLARPDRSAAEQAQLDELTRAHRIDAMDASHRARFRQNCQMVFQDSFASLNPRQLVRDIVGRPLRIHRRCPRSHLTRRVVALLEEVGLGREHLYRYPHQFSGGQRQRISIARALALEPDLVVLDEPTSSLDVSVQAQILNLLHTLQEERGLTYLFVSHDLNVVRHISDRVVVMYLGEIGEVGASGALFDAPRHPYTEALLAANPGLDDQAHRIRLHGDVPSPANPPAGCRFHTRCPRVTAACGWDLDDALRLLEQADAIDAVVHVDRRSPFSATLELDSAESADEARRLIGDGAPAAMREATDALEVRNNEIRVELRPVPGVELHDVGDGRQSACLLYQ
jgi:oligopeptide/dipeptide ABC transporter ATP-binding protein